ncbi:hypothetical protein BJ684DRAFT_18233 [Piptocephalis cylindrospora]|uniref:FAR-17a/AIG1-like protein-domain-containing protein n=1 Tax=Piptocephalis cylindrospora TaxID=1907219 RepID=A0A4P9Y8G0_9FUNG|nr:hypothetical protein BJ684DRAFT_18233 [Piptocephalis cylindrospora]|eukprot:RKP15456.1 hypothetical protein BJ684DRAFT_18233 [Piptocephalis cylindrospora]
MDKETTAMTAAAAPAPFSSSTASVDTASQPGQAPVPTPAPMQSTSHGSSPNPPVAGGNISEKPAKRAITLCGKRIELDWRLLINWQFDQLDPYRPVTSPCLRPSHYWVLRALFAIWLIVTFVLSLAGRAQGGILHRWPYTLEGFLNAGFMIYMISATFHTWRYATNRRTLLHSKWWMVPHHILWCTLGTITIFSTVGYWSYVYDSQFVNSRLLWFTAISQNVINPLILIAEFILGRQEYRLVDNIWATIVFLFYMFWMWIVAGYSGVWGYWIMGWDQGSACIKWYFIDTLLIFVAFFAIVFLTRARDHLWSTRAWYPLPPDRATTSSWPFKTNRHAGPTLPI